MSSSKFKVGDYVIGSQFINKTWWNNTYKLKIRNQQNMTAVVLERIIIKNMSSYVLNVGQVIIVSKDTVVKYSDELWNKLLLDSY